MDEKYRGTFFFWKCTRIEGNSASMCDTGSHIDPELVKAFDRIRYEVERDKAAPINNGKQKALIKSINNG